VIVDPAHGHILTNNHVIDNAVRIEVVLSDGRLLPAKLVGRDIGTDLAVIEVADRKLPTLPIGDSDRIRVGDVVAAIGNPFGLEGTATLGIVSATMRTEIGHEAFEDFLQIDAVINPGNSGGALVNVRGELIGINTATAGASGNVGIGFAIPINMARVIKAELIAHGRMRRGAPGLIVEDLTYERAAALMSGTNRGAIVSAVVPGSPAAIAGIEPGTIVTEIAGKLVRGAAEFNTRVVTVPLGTKLPIVLRVGGMDRRLVLETAAVALPAAEITLPAELGGLVVRDIALGNPLYGDQRGAEVARIEADGPAARTGLRAGDVVVGVEQHTVRGIAQLLRRAEQAGAVYRLRIVRDGKPGWVNVVR
jgi:S1-C subfamily serine protease